MLHLRDVYVLVRIFSTYLRYSATKHNSTLVFTNIFFLKVNVCRAVVSSNPVVPGSARRLLIGWHILERDVYTGAHMSSFIQS